MKKVIIIIVLSIVGLYCINEYNKNKKLIEYNNNKQTILNRLEEIEDGLKGYSKNDTTYFEYSHGDTRIYFPSEKYVIKENITKNRMLIYNGEGMCYIGTVSLEKGKYPTFRTEISFKSKSLYKDDINGFIRDLKRAKNAFIKYHNISVKKQISNYCAINITGDSAWFACDYCFDSGVDYVTVGDVGNKLKFNSVSEIDNMIKFLNKFKNKKLINVNEFYS